MPGTSIITSEQLDEFGRRGVLRLRGLFSADRVRRLREHVHARLARQGLWRNGAWHPRRAARPQWPATGLKTSQVIGNEHPAVEALLEERQGASFGEQAPSYRLVSADGRPSNAFRAAIPRGITWAPGMRPVTTVGPGPCIRKRRITTRLRFKSVHTAPFSVRSGGVLA